jgi:Protein of unknown function (DUF726)
MIEQLAEHGVVATDLSPSLKQNARVSNPVRNSISSGRPSLPSPRNSVSSPVLEKSESSTSLGPKPDANGMRSPLPLPAYEEHTGEDLPDVRTPSQLPNTQTIDIDLRWTVLCDLFLLLIADSIYDSRSRKLLEMVGQFLDVPSLDICRFEKRVTDALEMQEAASKENWNEDEHMENRRKMARNKRLMLMGLATVGGGLVIGLSAGLLAPVIGAGLAAGFTTIGVAGTGGFLAGAGGAAIVTTTGIVTGGAIAVKATGRRTGAVKTFEYRPLHNNKRVNLIVTVSGWMTGKVDDVRLPFSTVDPIMGDIYSVFWEPEMLQSMGDTINILATEALTQGLQQVLGSTILIALMAALQLPIVLTKLAYLIDNPWSVSVSRADAAGLILADSLTDRNLGSRPVTLVGFSLGSRVIFSCLRELADKGQCGLIQNVFVFGTPVVAKKDEWLKARTVVSGRFVSGYATNDWILGYLFRATGGAGISRVAGLAPVEIPGIENVNVTEMVPGHMQYRNLMPKLLREVGWAVESDEFTEIEDPDPENHEKRQRELISEIEEARKQLQEKPEKKRWALFGRKKMAEKKNWEMYDEKSQLQEDGKNGANGKDGVLFDVEAIRKEVAALSAEGIEVKQLESTMPPMKLDLSKTAELPPLRQSKSFNDAPTGSTTNGKLSPPSNPSGHRTPQTAQDPMVNNPREDSNISMAFDMSFQPRPSSSPPRSSVSTSAAASPVPPSASTWQSETSHRPALKSAQTMPSPLTSKDYMRNAWADEDEFGHEGEGEMKMTFE